MTKLSEVIMRGLASARPAAGVEGRLYHSTDTDDVEYDDGAAWQPWPGASPGGGGLTQEYIGHNAVGASTETATVSRAYLKKVTITTASLLTSVEVYGKQLTAANAFGLSTMVYDDVAGEPVHLLAVSDDTNFAMNPYRVAATAGDARWFASGIGLWLPADDYWIGFEIKSQAQCIVYYDAAGGSDCWWDKGGNTFYTDAPDTAGTVYTRNDTTRRYSVRGNLIR